MEAFGYGSHAETTPSPKNEFNNTKSTYILWANFGFSVAVVFERNQKNQ